MAGRVTPSVAGPSPTHDVILTDPNGVATGFMLYHENGTAPGIHISYEATEPPRHAEGLLRYSDVSPLVDLTWDIQTFHLGGMSNRWAPNIMFRLNEDAVVETHTSGRYNQANGIVASTAGEFGLANKLDTIGMYLRQQTFQASSAWVLTGSASIASNLLTLTTVGATATQPLNNFLAYANRSVTIGAIVTVTGADGVVRLGLLEDGVLQSANTTVTAAGSPQLVTFTRTVAAGIATSLSFSIDHVSGASTAMTCSTVFVYHTNATPATSGLLPFNSNLYAAVGAAVLQYNGANGQFDAVYVGPSACTGLGISPADNKLVAGFGTNGYAYYTPGDVVTTWTTKTGFGGPFASVRGRIWAVKTPTGNTVSSSADVVTGASGTWTDYTVVGVASGTINSLFAFNDTLIVGRTDGLWLYDRAINAFRDLTPEFLYEPNPENFVRGVEWAGWLYLSTRRGVLRYDGVSIENVSYEFTGPQIADFGGRIKAFTVDGSTAWTLMDTPTSDASDSKQTWLLSFDEIQEDNGVLRFAVHPTHLITYGDFRVMCSYYYNTTTSYLIALATLFISGSTYRPVGIQMILPARHNQPDRDITPDLARTTDTATGSTAKALITQYWDALLPDAQKALIKLTFRVDGTVDANKTVAVDYQVDEDTAWTALGTVSTLGLATLYFSSAALAKRNGRRIRLRFTINTNSTTLAPRVLCPIVLHAVYRPLNFRHIEMLVYVAQDLQMRNGQPDDNTASALITTLDGALSDNWVSALTEDEFGLGTVTSYNVFVRSAERHKLVDHPSDPNQRAWVYKVVMTAQTTS